MLLIILILGVFSAVSEPLAPLENVIRSFQSSGGEVVFAFDSIPQSTLQEILKLFDACGAGQMQLSLLQVSGVVDRLFRGRVSDATPSALSLMGAQQDLLLTSLSTLFEWIDEQISGDASMLLVVVIGGDQFLSVEYAVDCLKKLRAENPSLRLFVMGVGETAGSVAKKLVDHEEAELALFSAPMILQLSAECTRLDSCTDCGPDPDPCPIRSSCRQLSPCTHPQCICDEEGYEIAEEEGGISCVPKCRPACELPRTCVARNECRCPNPNDLCCGSPCGPLSRCVGPDECELILGVGVGGGDSSNTTWIIVGLVVIVGVVIPVGIAVGMMCFCWCCEKKKKKSRKSRKSTRKPESSSASASVPEEEKGGTSRGRQWVADASEPDAAAVTAVAGVTWQERGAAAVEKPAEAEAAAEGQLPMPIREQQQQLHQPDSEHQEHPHHPHQEVHVEASAGSVPVPAPAESSFAGRRGGEEEAVVFLGAEDQRDEQEEELGDEVDLFQSEIMRHRGGETSEEPERSVQADDFEERRGGQSAEDVSAHFESLLMTLSDSDDDEFELIGEK